MKFPPPSQCPKISKNNWNDTRSKRHWKIRVRHWVNGKSLQKQIMGLLAVIVHVFYFYNFSVFKCLICGLCPHIFYYPILFNCIFPVHFHSWTDDLRRSVWPRLVGIEPNNVEPVPNVDDLKSHPEYNQVILDVNRSLKRFPPGIPYEQRIALQDQLTVLILRVIIKYPHLRYYQVQMDL